MNDAKTPSEESGAAASEGRVHDAGGRCFQPPNRVLETGGRAFQPASFVPLCCALDDIAIQLDPAEPPLPTPAMRKRWALACRANPRLFNGRILRFMAFCQDTRTITARHDTYQRYAMQQHDAETADPATDIYHLAVTGVLTAADPQTGAEAVLLGKRGSKTFVYPGLWEHAPSGGLDTTDILGQLLREMEEELGIEGLVDGSRREARLEPLGTTDVLGLTIDPNTPSLDIVIRLRLRERAAQMHGAASWEYGKTRFVPVTELAAFVEQEDPNAIIPPTLAIWKGLGWV